MVEIRNVSKSFGCLEVLRQVNLIIPNGSMFGLVGRSGVGKSTLLRCINGLERYDTGSLLVNGIEVGTLSGKPLRQFRREVGMIFQHFSLVNRDTVFNNVALPMKCWHYDKAVIRRRVEELLELVDIPEKMHSKARELSGGQKQRVAIARALAMNPKVLLCDEATSALDPKSTDAIINLLTDVNRTLGITVVMVTHEINVVRRACDRIAIIEDGEVRVEGATFNVFRELPDALLNLLGEEFDLELPKMGRNIRICFSPDEENATILTKMARELDIDFMIIGEMQQVLKKGTLCTLTLNVDTVNVPKVERYLNANGVPWRFCGEGGDEERSEVS